MMSLSANEAKIRDGAGWRRIGVDEALKAPEGSALRYPECHGPMRVHREGTTGQRAHFEHRQRHSGCPTKLGFKGSATPHPHALD